VVGTSRLVPTTGRERERLRVDRTSTSGQHGIASGNRSRLGAARQDGRATIKKSARQCGAAAVTGVFTSSLYRHRQIRMEILRAPLSISAHHSGSWSDAVNKAALPTEADEFRRGRKDDLVDIFLLSLLVRDAPGKSEDRAQ
jgi:hypothetical protein